jgi:hypothetical protein
VCYAVPSPKAGANWFCSVATEEFLRPQIVERRVFTLNQLVEFDWSTQPEWMKPIFSASREDAIAHIKECSVPELLAVVEFSERFHVQDQLFDAFHEMLSRSPLPTAEIDHAMSVHPPLVFSLLKMFPVDGEGNLPETTAPFALQMIQHLIKCANNFAMAVLVAFEMMAATIHGIRLDNYCQLVELVSLCIRAPNVVQEVLLVLNDIRAAGPNNTNAEKYAYKHALCIAFDRVEEANDECPCDEMGIPLRQRSAPSRVSLHALEGDDRHVRVDIRIDLPNSVRLHSLVRLKSASRPERGWAPRWVMDGIVIEAKKGELKVELLHPPPAEMKDMDWILYNAGSIGESLFSCVTNNYLIFFSATAKAMMDAVQKLTLGGTERCLFARTIIGENISQPMADNVISLATPEGDLAHLSHLNESQQAAVAACGAPLSLIWGPPGEILYFRI